MRLQSFSKASNSQLRRFQGLLIVFGVAGAIVQVLTIGVSPSASPFTIAGALLAAYTAWCVLEWRRATKSLPTAAPELRSFSSLTWVEVIPHPLPALAAGLALGCAYVPIRDELQGTVTVVAITKHDLTKHAVS
jgi:hypothetical protein